VHNFAATRNGLTFKFHFIVGSNSIYIWVGDSSHNMKDLSIATPLCVNGLVTATQLSGDFVSATSRELAERFSKRTKKVVFFSFNAISDDPESMLFLQKNIEEQLKSLDIMN